MDGQRLTDDTDDIAAIVSGVGHKGRRQYQHPVWHRPREARTSVTSRVVMSTPSLQFKSWPQEPTAVTKRKCLPHPPYPTLTGTRMKPDFYISVDVETSGPLVDRYSMLSIGASSAGRFNGNVFQRISPDGHTFYAELKPDRPEVDREAVAVSGLDPERLAREGRDPRDAMTDFAHWARRTADLYQSSPIFVAYPLSFDWMWTYTYLLRYSEIGSPFGFSGCLDIKTLYAAKAGVPVSRARKRWMPERLLHTEYRHTHNALDDAREQADLFANLMEWVP